MFRPGRGMSSGGGEGAILTTGDRMEIGIQFEGEKELYYCALVPCPMSEILACFNL